MAAKNRRRGGSRSRNKRLVAADLVADLAEHYARDRNPLWVWLAVAECHDVGLRLPAWALNYLGHAARAVRELTRAPVPARPRDVVKALALVRPKGKTTVFEEVRATFDEYSLASRLYVTGKSRGGGVFDDETRIPAPVALKVDALVGDVAKQDGVSKQTVYRAWQRYGPALTRARGRLIK